MEIERDLELRLTSAEGRESTSFLGNAYDMYKQDPATKAEVMETFVGASLETVSMRDGVDRSRIVPVIKDRLWLDEVRRGLMSRGATELPEPVYEAFSADLIVVYAEDLPKNIRYIGPSDLELAKVDRAELRSLACENLLRLLPPIERHGADGLYMMTAGGDYEASLLLVDSIWTGGQVEVQGDIVVAIPTRDLLLVTGSLSPGGIATVRQMVERASSEGAYTLTRKLFVRRGGRFVEFTQDAQ